jgi:hypothetical protein
MATIRNSVIVTRVLATILVNAVALSAASASGGSGSGGSGSGGGKTTAPAPAPAPIAVLPTTPPTPDTLMRESFGLADQARPAGGNGTSTPYQISKSITGFWIEYPGSKDTAWLAPAEGQTWRICAESTNPYEMPSPLQTTFGNGCIISEWRNAITIHPVALMPFKAPASPYEISINGFAAPLPSQYLGFGFTDASVLDSNLETSGTLWLALRSSGTSVAYELRTNGMSGPVLAAGTTIPDPFTRLVLRYDPLTQTATALVNEAVLGTFPVALSSPRFVGIEGIGIADNFVVRKLP